MKAIWNLGFRPFFLFGAVWSALMILVWAIFQSGWLVSVPYPIALVWHAHEMIYGFAVAIMAGFLLTASQNWSGIPGVSGGRLIGLFALWASARILSVVWSRQPMLFALTDLLFIPALAISLYPYLAIQSQKRNRIFFLLLAMLFVTNLLIHLDALDYLHSLSVRTVLVVPVYVFTILIAIIGGRVIPFFASNATNVEIKRYMWVEAATFVSLAIFLVAITFWEFSFFTAITSLTAGLVQLCRWLTWKPWKAIRIPILWILYTGYVWIPIGLLLRAAASLGRILPSSSTHAFTAGAIGITTYAMMTRVSLGHTGRKIHASRAIVCGYIFLCLSSIVRVFGPVILPSDYLFSIEVSGWLWFLAFGLYVVIYGPLLWSPRLDGKPG